MAAIATIAAAAPPAPAPVAAMAPKAQWQQQQVVGEKHTRRNAASDLGYWSLVAAHDQ